ncbi:flagellar basal body P-ring formation chaperone FlgA [Aromatoleum petrolei]|uniref:Flagella basal body P-ring formation protein FlgA n=1 Tax=Aromatoleum petrolei TaxID=76116 RepID=A0ABX1MXH8_9RHOO|nr:flagellar basal body P-ring formation chaperone FlgA [Aromatoleum petrolei]NMF91366.1 flagellar basal body P-ring formation protein FlgA [Aromatoleum petrolei]QTQ38085.1 Flagella basal body P-ring formation protein FlgA [Aromatoleum petrolei]
MLSNRLMRLFFRNAIISLLALGPTFAAGIAAAQQPLPPVRQAVMAFLGEQTSGLPGKVGITVDGVDPQNQLPACSELVPFLPPGTRAWGRINVGVRCDSPVVWTIYVPAQISVVSDYLVAARPIRAGQVIAPTDLERRSGDLAAEAPNTLTDMTQAVGHNARFTIAAGNTLRTDMLRLPQTVRQGQNVKVIGTGSGFTVTNEGRALNAAAAGEPVRVRLGSGQVVSGKARGDGVVELDF